VEENVCQSNDNIFYHKNLCSLTAFPAIKNTTLFALLFFPGVTIFMAPVRAALPADGALPVFKPPAVPEQGSKVLTLWVHESSSPLAQHDCVVNPEFLPNVAPGQVLRVYSSKGSQQQQMSTGSPAQTQQNKQQQQTQAQSERQPSLTEPVIVKVAAVDKTTKQLQVSILYIAYTILN
jgi:hypothetical protein